MKFLSFSKGIVLSLLTLFCLSLTNVSLATYGHHHSYKSSIGDRVWIDENMNGLQDSGERGAANVKVLIGDCKLGKWIKWGKTDSNGKYRFSRLRASSYSIVIFPEYHNAKFSGAKISPYDKGAANKDSDAKYMGHSSIGIYGQTPCVSLGKKQHKRNIDFGFYLPKPNKLPDAVNDNYSFEVGDTVNQNIVAENDDIGDGCAAVEMVSGALPDGVTLAADGTLSGSPTTAGEYWIEYRLTDCNGDADKALVDFVITKPNKLPDAVNDNYAFEVGDAVNQNIVTENDDIGDGCAAVEILSGALPDGVTLAADGTLSGSPTTAGDYWIDYRLTDCSGDTDDALVDFVITKPNKLPDAVNDSYEFDVDQIVNQNIVTENDDIGDGCAAVEILSGALPDGVTLAADGTLSGSPTTAGEYWIDYRLTDCSGDTDDALVDFVVTQKITQCAIEAIGDQYAKYGSGHAITLSGVSNKLVFEPESVTTQTLPSGDFQLTGYVTDGDSRFEVDVTFSDYMASSSNPKLELKDSAYTQNGGPVDPSTWEFWATLSGTLKGVSGEWNGAVLDLSLRGPKAQLGEGANGKNVNDGFASWFTATVSSDSTSLPQNIWVGETFHGDFNLDIRETGECQPAVEVVEYCAISAEAGPLSKYSGGHTLWVPAISKHLRFEPEGFVTQELPNGDLQVTGTVKDGALEFDIDWTFSDKSNTNDNPKLFLVDSAYVENGGSIDPTTWMFYATVTGTMTGVGGDWDGVVLTPSIRNYDAQVGIGANGKNVNLGFSSWINLLVTEAPNGLPDGIWLNETLHGDIDIDLVDPATCEEPEVTVVEYCAVSAEPGQYSNSVYTHSVYLPAISPELRFEPYGFATQELPNGDLKISGTVKNGALEFDLDWTFSDKKNSHSNPKLSMTDAAYIANGGPIDPSTWMFYESLSGTLTGVGGDWDGVVLTSAIRMNPAQIGVGANGKTTNLGLSSWFSATITAAPNGLPSGFALNDTLNGDTALDLLDPSLCQVTPGLNDDEFTGSLRAGVTGNVLDNDTDLTAPITVEFVSGDIPDGVTLGADGTVSGLTASLGTFVSIYRVTDGTGFVGTAQLTIIIQ